MRNEDTDSLAIMVNVLVKQQGLDEALIILGAYDIPNERTFHFIHAEAVVTAFKRNNAWYCKY